MWISKNRQGQLHSDIHINYSVYILEEHFNP
jgi:hypothetical protein